MYNYKYFVAESENGSKKVIAVSTYAGKRVKGVAKCNPEDNFDLETGKKLAAARCNLKIAEKREARAEKKYNDAIEQHNLMDCYLNRMKNYYSDSLEAVAKAEDELIEIIKNL